MRNVLVSACLLGVACRYDGTAGELLQLQELVAVCHPVPVCAEIMGGLPTPRTPAERIGERVMTRDGRDVTAEYERGAREVLALARRFGCREALLKERSPSCGRGRIYDGTFCGRQIDGDGVCAALLVAEGIAVYGESETEELLRRLRIS